MKKKQISPLSGYEKLFPIEPKGKFTIRDKFAWIPSFLAIIIDFLLPLKLPVANRVLRKVIREVENREQTGENLFGAMVKHQGVHITNVGIENIPTTGACMMALNHPGGPDITAHQSVIHSVRPNDDAVIIAFEAIYRKWWANYLIPIARGMSKKLMSLHKADLKKQTQLCLEAGYCVTTCPSTINAREFIDGIPVDVPWKITFLSAATKAKVPLVIGNVSGLQSSPNFYKWAKRNANIAALMILREIAEPYKKNVTLTFSQPIPFSIYNPIRKRLGYDTTTQLLREYCFVLNKNPNLHFKTFVDSKSAENDTN